ncbi:alpha-amylase [Cohnella pontilimi]|uniref:Alpha-amylase n=1 Tax=Cohnella pontilimi TaxID=2564100 RepID=A0A4U0FHL9_9BACL|nr:alpha-amylase family glycosyl hydrolase [Cohnella pontilimi]TJY44475.1 alpha-amylase [Cohnella pontilimi]
MFTRLRNRKRLSMMLSLVMTLQFLLAGFGAIAAAAAPDGTTVGDDHRITFAIPSSSIQVRVTGDFLGGAANWGEGISIAENTVTEGNQTYVQVNNLEVNKTYEYKFRVNGNWMDGSNLTAIADANGKLLIPAASIAYLAAGTFDNNWANQHPLVDNNGIYTYTTGVLADGVYEYKLIARFKLSDIDARDVYFTDPTNQQTANGNSAITVGTANPSTIQPDTFTDQPGAKSKWVLAGTFQQALGDSGNWNPGGTATQMKHPVGDFYAYSAVLPAGHHEFKFTKNGSWDTQIGDNGNNIVFDLADTTKVNFYLNEETMQVRTNIAGMGGVPQYTAVLADDVWPRLVGTLQTQFGEPAWSPADAKQMFVDYYFNNTSYRLQRTIGEGTHEAKVVLGNSWSNENFGDSGNNLKFTLTEAAAVTFSFDNSAASKRLRADYSIADGGYDGNIQAADIQFDSRSATFKKPFGAIKQGMEDLTLRIAVKRGDVQMAKVDLISGNGSVIGFEMHKATTVGDQDYYEVVIPRTAFHEIGVWGYKFILIDGPKKLEYGDDNSSGGSGAAVDEGAVPFNLTVYAPDYKTPDWMKNAVVYQIFPDRFFDGDPSNNRAKLKDGYRGVRTESGPNAGQPSNQPLQYFDGGVPNDPAPAQVWGQWSDVPENPNRITPENKPYYPDAKSDGIWTNEFYGGDIEGIRQKLDYLQSLGITAIYLNPVAWAASNHKYDATDYKHLDPVFGKPVYNTPGDPASGLNYDATRKASDAIFMTFAKEAAVRGIHVLNDGVFNHVGDDSIYFDRYEKYPEIGAYEFWAKVWKKTESGMSESEAKQAVIDDFTAKINPADGQPYKYPEDFGFTTWFTVGPDKVTDDKGNTRYRYEGWWGYDSLPAMDAKSPQPGDSQAISGEHEWNNVSYRDNVIGHSLTGKSASEVAAAMQDSVSQRWLWMGGDGWRLDVAPDVSSETWKKFREAVKSAKGLTDGNGGTIDDPVILGEEWGVATRYLLGDQFDSVMNYRFRGALQDFIIGAGKDSVNPDLAKNFDTALEQIREDYPKEAWQAMLNLVDSHDTIRSITKLDQPTWEEENLKIAPEASDKALKQQALIAVFQMGYPGAPTVYYGDEVGLTGTKDPDSRRTFPWERVTSSGSGFTGAGRYAELFDTYKTAAQVRNANEVFRTGDLHLAYAQGSVIAYARKSASKSALVAVNAGSSAASVEADVSGFLPNGVTFTDQLGSGLKGTVSGGKISLTLPAMSAVMMLSDGTLSVVLTPSGLQASGGNSSVSLTWDAVPGADSYVVYRAPIEGGQVQQIGTASTPAYIDTNIVNGTKYYYAVSAVKGTGESLLTGMVDATPSFPIGSVSSPSSMADMTIGVGITTAEITSDVAVPGLTDDPALAGKAATNLTVQLVYYKDGDAANQTVISMKYKADHGPAKTYRAVFEPSESGVYHYFVQASTNNGDTVTKSGESSFTANADAADTEAPATPVLQEITVESGRAVLSWTGEAADVKGFEIYRASGNEVFRKIATVRNALTYTDFTVTNGTTYRYKVAVFDASYNRSFSGEQSVTPQLVMVDVTLRLHIPDYTPVTDNIYIAGDFNGWNSSGSKLTVPSGATDNTIMEYSFKMMAGRSIQYKFTRGTWSTEAFTSHKRVPNDTEDYGNWAYSSTDTNMRLTIANQGGNKMLVEDYVLRWVDMPMIVTMPRISYGDDISYETNETSFTLKASVPYGVAFTMNGTPLPDGAMDDRGNVYLQNIPLNPGSNEFVLHIEPTQETIDQPWYTDDGRAGQATKTIRLTINRTLSGNANLKGIALSGGAVLNEPFTPEQTGYTADVPYTVSSLTVTPAAADSRAAVTVNGSSPQIPVKLNVGDNRVTILVTAENGTTQSYAVTVKRTSLPVSDFRTSEIKGNTVTFKWTAARGASKIVVQQSTDGTHWTAAETGAIANSATNASVKGIKPHVTYQFRLLVAGGDNAGYSNAVTVNKLDKK